MLQEILDNHTPQDWEQASYPKTFLMFSVGPHDEEYDRVVQPFQDLPVKSVRRIQNPYIWGRFKLRKEQLERKATIYEHVMYHPISDESVNIVAEYNCDYRRYSPTARSCQYSGKSPTLYKTPMLAKDSSEMHAIVVVRVLHPNVNVSSTEVKGWESEYVPQYIVNLS